jgi:hypothetical protein
LVESISEIKLAALEALWTEERVPFPPRNERRVWEAWLRREGDIDHLERLRRFAPRFELTVGDEVINFVDRVVVLVTATAEELSRSIDILGMIAEVLATKHTAAFYAAKTAVDQRALVEGLLRRTTLRPGNVPYVCLLDTGVNQAHPLLTGLLDVNDLDTYKPAWGVDDRTVTALKWPGLPRSAT